LRIHDHERDDPDRGDADDRLKHLLLALGQVWLMTSRPTPTTTQIVTAAPTPIHIIRSASWRPAD
jgi:hypothetical protein